MRLFVETQDSLRKKPEISHILGEQSKNGSEPEEKNGENMEEH
jgi:hypothetical protein